MKTNQKIQGFTRIEVLVVIVVAGLLVVMTVPSYKKVFICTKLDADVNKIKQTINACASYAADYDGLYPALNHTGSKFSTSTEAFNVLIPEYVDMEQNFWIQTTNPDKLEFPNEDGELTRNENCYVYVTGQTNTSFSGSPLIADGEMISPGVYGKHHPWLKQEIAVIGYVGGHVRRESLTSSIPGATVKYTKPAKEEIYSIRQSREGDDENEPVLEAEMKNVLLP